MQDHVSDGVEVDLPVVFAVQLQGPSSDRPSSLKWQVALIAEVDLKP